MIYCENRIATASRVQKTFIIIGPPRSGTSMLSGCLKIMGVYMGESNALNHEDPRFNARNNPSEIRRIIEEINLRKEVWGWKDPSTHKYLSDVIERVRNPILIVSCRNPFDAARSKIVRTSDTDFPDK